MYGRGTGNMTEERQGCDCKQMFYNKSRTKGKARGGDGVDRDILHVDMNGFYASVEMLFHPEARQVPMAVGGDAQERHGVILAKNELAKQRGVKTAETIWQAKKKCPELLLLPPHRQLYAEYSAKANAIYSRFTDQVEPASIDESYLDVTGSHRLFGTNWQIAQCIRQTVKEELGLTVSVGISFCKVFAKMGSDMKKPDAVTELNRENWQDVLYPMPVETLLGVGAVTAARLRGAGMRTIGDVAERSRQALEALLGKHGHSLYEYVHGLEQEPVRRMGDHETPKSIGPRPTPSAGISWGKREIRVEILGAQGRRRGRPACGKKACAAGGCRWPSNAQLACIDRQTQLEQPADAAGELLPGSDGCVWTGLAPGQTHPDDDGDGHFPHPGDTAAQPVRRWAGGETGTGRWTRSARNSGMGPSVAPADTAGAGGMTGFYRRLFNLLGRIRWRASSKASKRRLIKVDLGAVLAGLFFGLRASSVSHTTSSCWIGRAFGVWLPADVLV